MLAGVGVGLVVPAASPAATYTAVDGGGFHTCAIKTDGSPVCWGYNASGQTTVPAGIASVTQISAGGFHTCAIKTDGTPVCWGDNVGGQSAVPVGIGSVTQITTGEYHTCVIKTDGTPVCLGSNNSGQSMVPAGIGTVTQVSAGGFHTCVIKTDGSPVCWGDYTAGQTTIPGGVGSVTQISAGRFHTCVIQTDGTPVCWGLNSNGQSTVPAGIGSVTQISAGNFHTCAIKSDGTPVCWGDNNVGQTTIPAGVGSVTQITAGTYHSCALRTDEAAVCWVYNIYGQSLVPPHSMARPVISGSPTVGSTLSASAGTWENAPTGYAYAWLRCSTNNSLASCSPIAGATQASYVVAGADAEFWLRVVVTASNASGSVAQHSYGVRVPPPPLSTVRPQISGSFRVGSVVSATTGEWENSPTGYAYAWQRCATNNSLASCSPIAGATQATYVLTAADDGYWVRVVVTASNSGGSGSRYSLPSVQVKRLLPVNTVRPVLSGSAQVGQALTTSDRGVGQRAGRLCVCVEALHQHPACLVHHDRRRDPVVLHRERRGRGFERPRVRDGGQQRR